MHPGIGQIGQVPGTGIPPRIQLSGIGTSYSPHILESCLLERANALFVRLQKHHTTAFDLVFFSEAVGQLGQCFGRGHPDRNRDAGPFFYPHAHLTGRSLELFGIHFAEVDEGLVHRIDFHLLIACEFSQRFHDAPAEITIQIVVRGEDGDVVLMDERACFEEGNAHGDAEFFGFVTACNDASVVVAEYHNGMMEQPGLKKSFAGTIETVAVDNGFHVSEWIT